MTGIGARSFTLILILIASLALGWGANIFRFEYVVKLGIETTLLIGFFSSVAAALIYHFKRKGDHSEFYFRYNRDGTLWEGESPLLKFRKHHINIGKSAPDLIFDFTPSAQKFLWVIIFVTISLIAFNNRGTQLLIGFPSEIRFDEFRYCPKENELDAEEEILPGCVLMKRAFDLGYAKDLGSCEPKEKEREEICTLRQWDEPYLHYIWRLVTLFTDQVGHTFTLDEGEKLKKKFEYQTTQLDNLFGYQKHVLFSNPKSSHHIWTNLPYPKGKWKTQFENLFQPNDCVEKYSQLGQNVKTEDHSSKTLEHVYGHLLFHPNYKPTVATCREYQIHWEAPSDSCEQLARNPEDFLKKEKLWKEILNLRDRYTKGRSRHAIRSVLANMEGPGLPEGARPKPTPRLNRVISFQCLMREDEPGLTSTLARSHTAKLFNLKFSARDIRINNGKAATATQIDYYKWLAQALSAGFTYGGFHSHQGIGPIKEETSLEELLTGRHYYLSRLDYLKSADLFVGNEWIQERPDLMELYPYYHHLSHFVEIFRKRYAFQKGRL